MLKYFNGSFREALASLYPEHDWQEWKFNWTTKGFWNDEVNVRKALYYLHKRLQIKQPDDWYSIPVSQLENMGFSVLLKTYGGLIPLLEKFFPENKWRAKTSNSKSKMQQLLFKIVNELFPDVNDYHFNYFHPFLRFQSTGKSMELDIYSPTLKLAFEYHGEHHYQQMESALFNTIMVRERDQEKKEACKKEGITLIEVPYWWDMTSASVRATIHQVRPDLIPNPGNGTPIPVTNPSSVKK